MRVQLIKQDRIRSINIPDVPSGNFWVTDYDDSGKEVNLLNIKEENNTWRINSNQEFYCVLNNDYTGYFELKEYSFYPIKKASTDEAMLIYCSPSSDVNSIDYYINPNENSVITIGSNQSSNIVFNSLDMDHARLVFENGKYVLYAISKRYGVYVNNLRVYDKKPLEYGDTIFLNGLKILFMKYQFNAKLNIYYYGNSLIVNGLTKAYYDSAEEQYSEAEEDLDMKWYKDEDYFHKTPRFVSEVKEKEIKIDVPPNKEPENEMPVILTVGPMLTMSMSSMVMAFSSIANVRNNGGSLSSAMPSIVMSIAMVASTLLWPMITRKFEDKRKKKKEKERIDKYTKYIESKRQVIQSELVNQTNILKRNYPSLSECNKIILEKNPILWQKRIEDEDFLKVNLGYGDYEMKLKITYPEEQFSMVEDELKSVADRLSREPKILKNVPVPYSFMDNSISSIIGQYHNRSEYLKKILFQIITFHSYIDLKIVILTDNDKKTTWKNIKNLPHCFTDDRQLRLFASKNEEYSVVCSYLEKVFNARKESESRESNPHVYDKIFLIITDSFKMVRSQDFIENLLNSKINYGFSLIISNGNISTLPEQCKSFIKVDQVSGELSKNVINEKNQSFLIDLISGINYNDCYKMLSNIPIETSDNGSSKIPDTVGFLEMYDVGRVEQLNSLNRWQNSNPMQTLATAVGYGKNNELQYIDLHEKAHGPHGLVAGMTGSGKSEFIISYILSLAVNYNPLEVQFILIDYKGGGLAGAFENASSGKKLPHLVGTITNLDASEIKRSISSIESELKRRQRLFNIARDKNGESTVDIYKYQRLYREGKVEEPVSHLFIISDEFAELKSQQPEFMDQLISTARIGRSLGVHLILATQKPSGVVDPQIWSNTRFRVCLRVQDKGDSNEVIKCPDAAFLKQTGRFYFQVGYNEVFTLGQAAWAGGQYIPKEKTTKPIDTTINFVNNVGQIIKQVDTKEKKQTKDEKKYGEELSNVVNYLYDIAYKENIKSKPLWLDKIPSFIKIDDLIKKYNYSVKPGTIDLPFGEFDIPEQQKQSILTVPISTKGNTIIYGSPGSGKENFLMTLIYESMKLYDASLLNYYLMDFGAELLKVFEKSSLVGDIISLDEEDKIINLYKMINSYMEKRKVILNQYGGNIFSYNEKNISNKLPFIIIVLNNFEAYQDTYEKYEDMLNILLRECTKYGIYFIVTCNTPNGMRFKLKQNFSQIFCLQQNNEDDYSSILGNVNKTYPSKLFGRGIIKFERVYEFQTASIDVQDNINNTINKVIEQSNNKVSVVAKKVPVLPKVVNYNAIKDEFDSDSIDVIVGIEKASLDVCKYNFTQDVINVISSNDDTLISTYANALIAQLKCKNNVQPIVFDAGYLQVDDDVKQGIVFQNSNFDEYFEKLIKYQDDCNNLYVNSGKDLSVLSKQKRIYLIINQIGDFKNNLSSENKNKLEAFVDLGKELGIINIIVLSTASNIKTVEYDNWFKNNFNQQNAIWLGQGIEDQFTIKVTTRTSELKENIDDTFGFVVKRGKPILIKYLSEFKTDDNFENLEL